MRVAVRWSGGDPANFEVTVADDATVSDLKRAIESVTNVRASRVKLLNLRLGAKLADDDAPLASVKVPKVVMMMGARDSVMEAMRDVEAQASASAPTFEDDLDIDTSVAALACERDPRFLERLAKRVESHSMKFTGGEPRVGAKMLVLDIDYTLFDHRTPAERPEEIARPFLHEFLTRAHRANFDIVIWSATSLKWIELKMTELGVLTHTDYKIVGLLDSTAMITVETEKYGVFNCKPLGFLFAQKFPEGVSYGPHNTIMFDDLSRNFVMNPQLGLKIRPFKNAHTTRHTDRELLRLADYIEAISTLDDFRQLDHNRWEHYLETIDKRERR